MCSADIELLTLLLSFLLTLTIHYHYNYFFTTSIAISITICIRDWPGSSCAPPPVPWAALVAASSCWSGTRSLLKIEIFLLDILTSLNHAQSNDVFSCLFSHFLLWTRGGVHKWSTPSSHPFSWDFPWNKPSSELGVAPWLWNPPCEKHSAEDRHWQLVQSFRALGDVYETNRNCPSWDQTVYRAWEMSHLLGICFTSPKQPYLLEIVSPIVGWCLIGTFTNPWFSGYQIGRNQTWRSTQHICHRYKIIQHQIRFKQTKNGDFMWMT